MAMFRLERDKSKESRITCDWIDVLAVIPTALTPVPSPKPYPEGSRVIQSVVLCLTPEGPTEFCYDALLDVIQEEEFVVV